MNTAAVGTGNGVVVITMNPTPSPETITAQLQLYSTVVPASDPGLFNLVVDGSVAATGSDAGNGGGTGILNLPAGTHTVAVEAGTGTDLARYQPVVLCAKNGGAGQVVATVNSFGPLSFSLNANDYVVCFVQATVRPSASASSNLSFGNQTVNSTSAVQQVTITSNGPTPLITQSVSASGDFQQTNNCGTIAPNATCAIDVTFTPTLAGPRSGTISYRSNALQNTLSVALDGNGVSPVVTTSASTLDFGSMRVGGKTAAHDVTISNQGPVPLLISSVTVNFSDYVVESNCPSSVNVGSNCTVSVSFAPKMTGIRTAVLTVASNASAPISVNLTGIGTTPMSAKVQVRSSANPAIFGQPIDVTATVSDAGGSELVPTGTLTFYDGATAVGSQSLDARGSATVTLSGLPVGKHQILVKYSGDSMFEGLSSAVHYPVTEPLFDVPYSLVAGDLDADGTIEVVAGVPHAIPAALVYISSAGTQSVPQHLRPYHLVVGDFAGIGRPRVAFTDDSEPGYISYQYDSSLSYIYPFELDYQYRSPISSLAAGDVTGDGKADLVVEGYMTSYGYGTFILPSFNGWFDSFDNVPISPYVGTTKAIVASLNGDGIGDYAAASYSNTAEVYLSQPGGRWTPLSLALGGSPADIVAGDLSGSGSNDLAVAIPGEVVRFPNLSGGSFAAPDSISTGGNPFRLAIGDMNGDGKNDLIVAFSNRPFISVFLNSGSGTFSPGSSYTFPSGSKIRDMVAAPVRKGFPPSVFVALESPNQIIRLRPDSVGKLEAASDIGNGYSQIVRPATPPSYVVTTNSDSSPGVATNCTDQSGSGAAVPDAGCSLRDALAAAETAGAGNITFSPSYFTATGTNNTITLTSGSLNVPALTTITGPLDANRAFVAVDGAGRFQIFNVDLGITASISNLKLQHGNDGSSNGAAISNHGTLTLSNCTLSENASSSLGGAIYNTGQLTAERCTFSSNSAMLAGALFNSTGASATVHGCTVKSNTANAAAGGFWNGGQLAVVNSTITGNSARGDGGGILNSAGSTLIVSNVTVVNNFTNGSGGGIANQGVGAIIVNSIVAANAGTAGSDVGGSYTDGGGNVVGSADLKLSPLGDYGGAMQTMIPQPGSPAICAGDYSKVGDLITDQREVPRTTTHQSAGGTQRACVDAGAVQTNYSLEFSRQPSPVAPASAIVMTVPFSAAVTLKESGVAFASPGVTIPVALTGTGTLTGAIGTTDLNGVSAYNMLAVSAPGTGDTLTASLMLTATGVPDAISISTTSIPFDVMPQRPGVAFQLIPASQVYGTPFPMNAITASATLAGNTVTDGSWTYTYTESGNSTPQALVPDVTILGAGDYTVAATFTPSDSATYQPNAMSADYTVTPATPEITWSTPAEITYGTNLSTVLTATATSTIPSGTLAYGENGSAIDASTILNAGQHTLTAIFTTTDPNYVSQVSRQISLNVVKATPIVTWTDPPDITYGAGLSNAQLNATFTCTVNGSPLTVAGTPTYTPNVGTLLKAGDHQPLQVSFAATDTSNFNTVSATVYVNVNKAMASVTPTASSKAYGANDPPLNGVITGFLAADNVTATYSRTPGESVSAGPYTISATLAPTSVLSNYDITYATAPFTVNKAPARVTPNAASKSYGASDPVLTGVLSGFMASDNVTAAYTRIPGETVAGGPYLISATLSPSAVLSNYDIHYGTAQFTIEKVIASVTPTTSGKTYGTADPVFTGNLAGFLASDDVTATYTRTPGETVAGGPYVISATLSPPGVLNNYTITYNTANFIINQAAASVTPTAISKIYGTADPTLTGTLTGFVAGDNVTATYSRAPGESVAGGPYTISATVTPSGALGNYNITYNTANLTINKAPASVTPSAASKTFGTPDPPLSGTLSGFLTSDNVSATYTRTSGEAVADSPYIISATLSPTAVLDNYDLSYGTAPFTITKAPTLATLQTSANTVMLMSSVTLTARVTATAGVPTGTVDFMNSATTLGSSTLDESGSATLSVSTLSAGPHSLTAVYRGDSNFEGITSTSVDEIVQDFQFVAAGGTGNDISATVTPGGVATYKLRVRPTNGTTFFAPVFLSLSGLPPGATYTITPAVITAGSAAQTITLQVQTSAPVANLSRGDASSPLLAFTLLLPMLGVVHFGRFGTTRKNRALCILSLLLLCVVLGMSACGSGSHGLLNQAPQTYNLQLDGTSGPLQHSLTLNLTIR
ncbi:MAG TPA: MBG domain-containing protein [Terriglobales bacterium]|nr:MBG domain-containing protein [Terriglobales bacterium]